MGRREDGAKGSGDLARRFREAGEKAAALLDEASRRHAWVAVSRQALADFLRHDMTLHAGNFAFSAFLAVFPLMLLVTSIIGFVFSLSPETMRSALDALTRALPEMPSAISAAADSMVRLKGVSALVGLLGLLWTASKITFAIQTGFEQVWEVQKRSFLKKRLFALGVLLLLLAFAMASLAINYLSSQLLAWIGEHLGPLFSVLSFLVGLVLGLAASALIFVVLYRTLPMRKPGWREVVWGAGIAALLLYVAQYVLNFYFSRVSRAEVVYGSIGIVMGVLLWLYVIGMLVFLGAEVVHVLQERWEPAAESALEFSEGGDPPGGDPRGGGRPADLAG